MLTRRQSFAVAAVAVAGGGMARPGAAADVRAFGAVGDGRDDTKALLRAHASGRALWYPRTSHGYRINETLPVTADVLSNGALIIRRQDGSTEGAIFRVSDNARPLTIQGVRLDGEFADGKAGEWSHCISLLGASGVTLQHNELLRPYGDCVYLGTLNGRQGCSDIRILDNRLIGPRRCCVALVCGENVRIEGNRLEKRHPYAVAVDLEPNPNGFDYFQDIAIRRNFVNAVTTFVAVDTSSAARPGSGVVIEGNVGFARTSVDVNHPERTPGLVNRNNWIVRKLTSSLRGLFI